MKREYEGEPIDATYQHLTERPDIEVPSDGGYDGSVTTDVGDGTLLQQLIKRLNFDNPDMGYADMANALGCDKSYVYEGLEQLNGW